MNSFAPTAPIYSRSHDPPADVAYQEFFQERRGTLAITDYSVDVGPWNQRPGVFDSDIKRTGIGGPAEMSVHRARGTPIF
jgi:hypothetical protein